MQFRYTIAKLVDWTLEISEFEIPSRCYVQFHTDTFGKGINAFVFPAIVWIVSMILFNKDVFDIKYPSTRMPLNNLRSLICH